MKRGQEQDGKGVSGQDELDTFLKNVKKPETAKGDQESGEGRKFEGKVVTIRLSISVPDGATRSGALWNSLWRA